MSKITFVLGEKKRVTEQNDNTLISEAAKSIGLPIDMACGGLGKCGQCRIIIESGGNAPDETERALLSKPELDAGIRLACRARVQGETAVVLAPMKVYSNKEYGPMPKLSIRGRNPLGLAVDFGTTAVAAYLVALDKGEIIAGAAALNQQQIYGADVISRMSAALKSSEHSARLSSLAMSSINQAVKGLNISDEIMRMISRVVIVGNPPMHHLLLKLPVDNLAKLPFQPFSTLPVKNGGISLDGHAGDSASVSFPPLIGGFVGSDALACLAQFDFDFFKEPQLAVDLGTNGEVLLSDGERIFAASTAAGPAFEGVNISCGMRAEDGAVTGAHLVDGEFALTVIGDSQAQGLSGSGLMQAVSELVRVDIINKSGRITEAPAYFTGSIEREEHIKKIFLSRRRQIFLTQKDIRELQKAKGAISAAIAVLLKKAGIAPRDLSRIILTGSFGAQLDKGAAIRLGIIPDIDPRRIQSVQNGAGMGAAIFLTDSGFKRGEVLAKITEHVDIDNDPDFLRIFVDSLAFKKWTHCGIERGG